MLIKIFSKFKELLNIILNRIFYSFVVGHSHIDDEDIIKIKERLYDVSNQNIEIYEKKFSKLVGSGKSLSLASARMCFYLVLKNLNIKKGDEVILNGSTCSVMVNAVLRTNATPIFSDISKDTFGSSLKGIKKVYSSRTKIIVAQHSFGIPCEIDKIKEFADKNNVFLLEDCALSVGSKIADFKIGTFGNAAIFSTDRSKPLNTIIGGMIYTENENLYNELKLLQNNAGELNDNKILSIWNEFILERKYCNPLGNRKYNFISSIRNYLRLVFQLESPFLDQDSGISFNNTYPYPAKLPNFLSEVGILEIQKWNEDVVKKKKVLKAYIKFMKIKNLDPFIPKSYLDTKLDIIPSRFVFSMPNGENMRTNISKYLNTAWIWFMEPIVATNEPLHKFGYKAGSCPIAEEIGKGIINLPINLEEKHLEDLLNKLTKEI